MSVSVLNLHVYQATRCAACNAQDNRVAPSDTPLQNLLLVPGTVLRRVVPVLVLRPKLPGKQSHSDGSRFGAGSRFFSFIIHHFLVQSVQCGTYTLDALFVQIVCLFWYWYQRPASGNCLTGTRFLPFVCRRGAQAWRLLRTSSNIRK